MINGRSYDWQSLRVQLPSGPAIQLKSITYKDGKEKNHVYGAGFRPQATGHGDYSAGGTIEMRLADAERFEAALDLSAGGQGFYNAPPFPIAFAYANKTGPTVKITLKDVEITNRSSESKRKDGETTRKYDFICTDVVTNSRSAAGIGL